MKDSNEKVQKELQTAQQEIVVLKQQLQEQENVETQLQEAKEKILLLEKELQGKVDASNSFKNSLKDENEILKKQVQEQENEKQLQEAKQEILILNQQLQDQLELSTSLQNKLKDENDLLTQKLQQQIAAEKQLQEQLEVTNSLLNSLKKENEVFKAQLQEQERKQVSVVQQENVKLDNAKLVDELTEQLKVSISSHNVLQLENESLKTQLQDAKQKIVVLEKELQETFIIQKELQDVQQENFVLKEQLQEMSIIQDKLESAKKQLQEQLQKTKETLNVDLEKDLHKKYVNILAASIKKYLDGRSSTDFQGVYDDCNLKEFTMQLESVLKLILDFKLKMESLEKELFEKAKMVSEKNYEIEKLLKNSEILSQEVITKTQTIKDYEIECSELMKNNEILINELENYKNSSGLQTISESNEDNMVLLETQLECASKRIGELESELATTKDHCKNLDEQHKSCNSEKDELKTNYENNEYKCAELKIMQDTLKEELEKYEKMCADLTTINKQYEIKQDVLQKQIEELHQKLLAEEELRLQLQTERNNLTEKLQGFKMAETSLKLHFNNELQIAVEAKQEIENRLSAALCDLNLCKENLKKLQEQNLHLEEKQKECNDTKTLTENLNKLSLTEIQSWSTLQSDHDLENEKLQTQLNELIALVNSKQQENITYHTEIQRLNQILLVEIEKNKQLQENFSEKIQQKQEEIEKLTDQNNFLQGKCDVLTQNLLQQQGLEKELERLRAHLVEIEETYTQELIQAERKNQEIQAKMNEIEEREKNSSTLYTSVSIRANQQVEALQNQIQLLMAQRDELRKKVSDAEDENSRQAAALTNLNFVLQQFQKGKD